MEGSPFRLSCDLPKGYPKPNVFWSIQKKFSTVKVIRDTRKIWDAEGSLWFSNVIASDASEDCIYVCFVTSKVLNRYITVKQVYLEIISGSNKRGHPLALQYVSSDKVSRLGEKVDFFCIYSGDPHPIVSWTKNGLPIRFDNRTMLENFGKTLVMQDTNESDKGSYTCEVSNGLGEAHSWSIDLDVEFSPVFIKEPMSVVVLAKHVVTFECEAHGSPEPTNEWILNGKLIEIAQANRKRTITNNKIVIVDVDEKDTGNYGCNASNHVGYVYKDFYLYVLDHEPPKFLTQLNTSEQFFEVADLEFDTKNPFSLVCEADGKPKPT